MVAAAFVDEMNATMISFSSGDVPSVNAGERDAVTAAVTPVIGNENPPDAAAVAVAQERYSRAQAKLFTHGPAPTKPSSEKKTFGTRGIANADPAAVARWRIGSPTGTSAEPAADGALPPAGPATRGPHY